MASTFSTNLNLELQGTGDNPGTWGGVLNANALDTIDQAMGDVQTFTLSNVNVTVSTAQSQKNAYILTGVLTGNVIITWPAIGRTYFIVNNTTGNFTVTLRAGAAATSVIMPQGRAGYFTINVDNIYRPTDAMEFLSSGNLSGGSVIIPLAPGFAFYQLRTTNVLPVTSAANLLIRLRLSGVTYSANYSYARWALASSGATGVGSAAGTGTAIEIANSIANVGGGVGQTIISIAPAVQGQVMWETTWLAASGLLVSGWGSGVLGGIAPDSVVLLMSSGNISSGTYYLYGIK